MFQADRLLAGGSGLLAGPMARRGPVVGQIAPLNVSHVDGSPLW